MPAGLFTDFYELTMAAGYHAEGMADEPTVFDLFFRDLPVSVELGICAGLESAADFVTSWGFDDDDLSYLRDLDTFAPDFIDRLSGLRFTGELCGIPEGRPIFPNEPVIRVTAPLIEAQLVETALINHVAHGSLMASHAAQIVTSAHGKSVLEFGARRAHGPNGAISGSRAAMIGGCSATSLTEVGKRTGARVSGTQAHSWIMAFEDELAAFRAYARTFPASCVLLVDTYDTLGSGVPHAITVARELREDGYELQGIRLDSGDLVALAFESRRMLDRAGFGEVQILASGDLNAARITEIEDAGAPIDAYGVGTELATARPDAAFTAVYKLAQIGDRPVIKVSSSPAKTTDPGTKQVWRTDDGDVVGLVDEDVAGTPLLEPVVSGGERIRDVEPLETIVARCRDEGAALRGRAWPVRRTPRLDELRDELRARYS